MKIRFVVSPNFIELDYLWVFSLCYFEFFQELKKVSEFESVVISPREVEFPSNNVLVSGVYGKYTRLDHAQELDADVIIIPGSCVGNEIRAFLPELIRSNPRAIFWFLWIDCNYRIESKVLESGSALWGHSHRFVHLTHWTVRSLPNQIVIDFPYNHSLELPLSSEKEFDFGFVGFFLYAKKNTKFLEYATRFTSRPLSIVGMKETQDRLFGEQKDVLRGKTRCWGEIFSWEESYPILAKSWIYLNSQKRRHRSYGSIVKRPTSTAELGSIFLVDPEDRSSHDIFPPQFVISDELVRHLLAATPEQKLGFVSYQREWLKTRLDSLFLPIS